MTDKTQAAPPTPERGTPEYNAMMVEKYEKGFATQHDANQQDFTQTPPARPEHVPEKFWNAETGQINTEALLKSYTELEKAKTTPTTEKPEGTPDPDKSPDTAEKQVIEDAGLNWDEVETYVNENGQLAEEHYAALEKIGVPRKIVDSHLELLAASTEFAKHRTEQYVGGKAVLDTIMQRAAKELAPDEANRFNELLSSPNWPVAMDALKARFAPDAVGTTDSKGDLFAGFGAGGGDGDTTAFKTRLEMTSAINKRDEKGRRFYDIDPQYRRSVQQRIALMA